MNNSRAPQQSSTLAAYLSAALYVALFAFLAAAPTSLVVPIIAVALHLVLFFVVAALPSPTWARAGGYGWLVVDITSNVMAINGVDPGITTALRLGGHVAGALWIAGASYQARGAIRPIGLILAVIFAGYSLVAPWVPLTFVLPLGLLLIAWLVLVGRSLGIAARQ